MKTYRQPGSVLQISGISSGTIPAGSLYRRTGGTQFQRAWIGIVIDDIVGTGTALTTLDGRPIDIGDGRTAEAQYGTGKGDMKVDGVFTCRLPASGSYIVDGDPLWAIFNETTKVASGVTDNINAAGSLNWGPISGALVGYAVGGNYTATQVPFVGMNVVDVKLLGFPLHGIAWAGPAE